MIYCVIPYELAPDLHEALRAFYAGDPNVEVVVERRGTERRQASERRIEVEGPKPRRERRKVRSASGRRVDERRAEPLPAEAPPLPPEAEPHAARLTFVQREEPDTLDQEDKDTARLVIGLQAGDRTAFRDIYLRYFDRVYGYLQMALNDPHEAEDMTHEIFIKALESLPAYEVRGAPFRAWLFRIVRNHAINRLKRAHRVEVSEPEEMGRRRERDAEDADAELPGSGDWLSNRTLMAMVERLPLAQRQVVVMRYMMGFGSPEIAEVLDSTPDAIRQLHQRAMRFLRARLDSDEMSQVRGATQAMSRRPQPAPVLGSRRSALGG